MRRRVCGFYSLDDTFNFGRYKDLSLADVLDINPSYVNWCIKHCTGVVFRLYDEVIKQIVVAYPLFKMDGLFESRRIYNLNRQSYYDSINFDDVDYSEFEYNDDWYDTPTFDRYNGFWAQSVEGYSDNDIDTIFDGDPSAYWNIN